MIRRLSAAIRLVPTLYKQTNEKASEIATLSDIELQTEIENEQEFISFIYMQTYNLAHAIQNFTFSGKWIKCNESKVLVLVSRQCSVQQRKVSFFVGVIRIIMKVIMQWKPKATFDLVMESSSRVVTTRFTSVDADDIKLHCKLRQTHTIALCNAGVTTCSSRFVLSSHIISTWLVHIIKCKQMITNSIMF